MKTAKRSRSQYVKRKSYGHSYGKGNSKYRATKTVYKKRNK